MEKLKEEIVEMIYGYLPYSTKDSIRANVDEILSLIEKSEPVANPHCSDGLDSFAEAIRYILYEIEAHPGDSLRDIANDALMDNKIPLVCKMIEGDYKLLPYE